MNNSKLFLVLMLMCWMTSAIAQDAPIREITNITDDLYRFQNNTHFTVFLVTDEGIIVTDPVDKEAAAWVRNELK